MLDQTNPDRRRFLGAAAGIAASLVRLPFVKSLRADPSLPTRADVRSLPDLSGAVGWLNSAPLSGTSLRGKVVLVDFWTYTCINSLRQLPYLRSWAGKYGSAGFVVIGVHTPEFSFEKERPNVERAVRDLKVAYPVAIDSNYGIWQAFNNEYWPADYFIDGKGRIRHHHFGEGEYEESERVLQQLIKENGATGLDGRAVNPSGDGIEAAASWGDARSPETYVGYNRGEHFASPEPVARDTRKTYSPPAAPALNEWGLSGSWNVGGESAVLQAANGKIVFRFHSRDLHLVLAPGANSRAARFKVTLDGTAPGADHGIDAAADGSGEVRAPRLYQLIRQHGRVEDRTFEIEFSDPGVRALVFTFG